MHVGELFQLPCGHYGDVVLVTNIEVLVRGPKQQPYCDKCHPFEKPEACTFFIVPRRINQT